MARVCELTGKAVLVGNRVSHSNRKTKHRFLPNLHMITFHSEVLERAIRFKVSTNGLRSVDHRGGLDAFLIKSSKDCLSQSAREIKREIEKKLAASSAA